MGCLRLFLTVIFLSCSVSINPGRYNYRDVNFPSIVEDNLTEEDTCNTMWFVKESSSNSCNCGDTVHGAVFCDNVTRDVAVIDCYCMTEESHTHQMVVGECVFNCVNLSRNAHYEDLFYHPIPSWCEGLHRAGTLCGRCSHEDHYYPPAYSYDLDCIKCHIPHSVWLYIAVAFVPLTLFIALILAFRISAVNPPLRALVCASQVYGLSVQIRVILFSVKYMGKHLRAITKVVLALYGIWNLDFFRTLMLGVCLHLNTVEVIALDYLIAIYPMLLTVVAYIIIELHARGFEPVLLLWKPFHKLSARFRRSWDVQTSLIDAFATFFVLSTTKLFSVSADLLIPTNLYLKNGNRLGTYLYYDPNLRYLSYSSGHIYYGILAIALLLLLVALPLSLLCCKCFRSWCRLTVLNDFLHTFQKYYKDGSGGTRDYRWYAAFHHIVLFGIYVIYSFVRSEYVYQVGTVYFTLAGIVVLILEPYKKEYAAYNILDCILYLWLALFTASITQLNLITMTQRDYIDLGFVLPTIVGIIPILLFLGMLVRWLLRVMGYKKCKRSHVDADGTLPHRITHSNEYKDSCGYVTARTSASALHKTNDVET